jgi:nucleotide-binding universal stress UspA family protein
MTEPISLKDGVSVRIGRILFSTDFSEVSARALPYAAAVARRFGSTLYVVHVIPSESYEQIASGAPDAALDDMRKKAEERITTLLESSHFSGIPHRVVLVHGEVRPVLFSLVKEHHIDLIVAGAHGRHGVEKLLSGSMAEEIFRQTPCPVMLVGPEVTIAPEDEVHLERILYVTDFSPESRPAADYAYTLAKVYSAQLHFLHVVENLYKEPLSNRMTPDAFCRLRLLENGWPEREQGIDPEFHVEFGERESLTLQAATRLGAQLIVVGIPGTGHPDFAAHLPGPLAYNVMSHAHCPVLGVPGEGKHDHETKN